MTPSRTSSGTYHTTPATVTHAPNVMVCVATAARRDRAPPPTVWPRRGYRLAIRGCVPGYQLNTPRRVIHGACGVWWRPEAHHGRRRHPPLRPRGNLHARDYGTFIIPSSLVPWLKISFSNNHGLQISLSHNPGLQIMLSIIRVCGRRAPGVHNSNGLCWCFLIKQLLRVASTKWQYASHILTVRTLASPGCNQLSRVALGVNI